MSDVIIYLLKVIVIQGAFFLVYWLLFRKTVHHALNRAFLLAAIVLSFAIPFIELPSFQTRVPEVVQDHPVIVWLSEPPLEREMVLEPIEEVSQFSLTSMLPVIYLAVTVVLIVRSVVYLIALQKLKRQSESVHTRWYRLFRTSQTRSFSFFKNVFIPRSIFGSDAFDQVLAHECVHVRRLHSVDRLLLDFVVSLFWFNPFIYCYRNALIEIHEYQADEGVLKQYQDPVTYQEVLFSQLQSPEYSGLVSHFNFQMIKKRIVMMNKQKKRTGWIYGLTVPVTLMLIFAFSSKEAMEPLNEVGHGITTLIGPLNEVKDYTEVLLQDSNEPSISPVRSSDLVRLSSEFGMRMHPKEKVRKMHFGVDFACPVGTEILATADGKVSKVQTKQGGYGKLIVLDHGNDFQTYYAQLSEFKVKEGDVVKKGQVIALSGNSGASTGPHLHYEVKKGDKRVNPKSYIKDYKFTLKEIPKVKEVEGSQGAKSKQNEVAEEQELPKLEQEAALRAEERELERESEELRLREMELVKAAEMMAKEEQERARELAAIGKEEELAKLEEMRALEEAEIAKIQEEKRLMEEMRYQEQRESINVSLQGTNGETPLYVIDGEEVKKINNLDPNEIKSVTVLKGDKAKAKYGKKGKNGVVEIISKNSKEKTKIKNKEKNKSKKQE